jgi:DNA-binding transcriptional regulator PaaX
MGKIEKRVKKRARKQNIKHAVLTALKVGGLLGVAVVAPNALQLLTYTNQNRSAYAWRANAALARLVAHGYVAWHEENGKKYARITSLGESFLIKFSEKPRSTSVPKKWDQKWRMVIFDVPERRRTARNQLRAMLASVGFVQLQGSVWVYPYDSEDVVTLIKTQFVLGREVLYAVVEELEGDTRLRKRFNLSKP